MTDFDHFFMHNALKMGRRHLGQTWPNPSVGAVLVHYEAQGPVMIGRGVTQPGGRPHAERMALAVAGDRAKGSTLYVTLEPCSHHGRTSPCSEAVIAAGITRVVVGTGDPDLRVKGRGIAGLRQAGIEVVEHICEAEATRLHRGHISRVTKGRPFVTLKLAQTADGFAGSTLQRLIITGDEANTRTHLLRAKSDCILIGIGTALADNPRLNVRLEGIKHQPVRVVLDARLQLPLNHTLVQTARQQPTWLIVGDNISDEALVPYQSCEVVVHRAGLKDNHLDLDQVFQLLGTQGLTTCLCEGGPALANALAQHDLIDEIIIMSSPHRWEKDGIPAIGSQLQFVLAHHFQLFDTEYAGIDKIDIFRKEQAIF